MKPTTKKLIIECHGFSLILDSLNFHTSIFQTLKQQTDQLLILNSSMDEVKREIELLFENKKFQAKLQSGNYLASQFCEQLQASTNFKDFQQTLRLRDQKLLFAIHEPAFINRLVITILLQKRFQVNVFHFHKFFSLAHLREDKSADGTTLNLYSQKAVLRLTYSQFVDYVKLGCFKAEEFLSVDFEAIHLQFKCLKNIELKAIIDVFDLNQSERKSATAVYMLPIFTSEAKRAKILASVVDQLPEKRIVAVQAFYERNFKFENVQKELEPVLAQLNPKGFQAKFNVYASQSDLGSSSVLFENERVIVEELTVDESLKKRRLYFKDNIHLIQSELLAINGLPDFSKPKLNVYKEVSKRILELANTSEKSAGFKMCMLGGGAACFGNHLSKLLEPANFELIVVDIDPLLKEIAEKFFFFKESEKMKYTICDAVEFIKKSKDGEFDAIFVDIDSKDGNSPPEEFLRKEFVLRMIEIVKKKNSKGFVAFNCVFEDSGALEKKSAEFGEETKIEIVKKEGRKNLALFLE